MPNGTPLSPGKLILTVVGLSLTITSVSNIFINSSINKQSSEIKELRSMIFERMDDRYRRAEAIEAHKSISERVDRVEKQDDKLEKKIDVHIEADRRLHDKG
jgi:hypothetical protein